jgi:hypothetical protein
MRRSRMTRARAPSSAATRGCQRRCTRSNVGSVQASRRSERSPRRAGRQELGDEHEQGDGDQQREPIELGESPRRRAPRPRGPRRRRRTGSGT